MKTKHIIIVGIIGAILVGAGGFWFFFANASVAWTEDWGQEVDGLTGMWIIEPYYIMNDGTRIPIRDATQDTLKVKYGGAYVESVQYVLKCQATRNDASANNYQSVEIDFDNLKINARYFQSITPYEWVDVWKDSFQDKTINFPSGATQTAITEVAWFTIPVMIDSSLTYLGGTLPQLPCDTLSEMTDGWELGSYTVRYSSSGSIKFRGKNSNSGDSAWFDTTLPGIVTHGIIVEPNNEVSVDWSSSVTYGDCNPNFDVNGDGVVNYLDPLTINAHINSGAPYNEAYDMNCDGVINSIDYYIVSNQI